MATTDLPILCMLRTRRQWPTPNSMATSLGADPYSRRIAGSVIAQQLGLGFVTAVDPTQGEQGMIVGNFLTLLGITLLFATDMHHLVIAASGCRCRSCSG